MGLSALNQLMNPLSSLFFLLWKELLFLLTFPALRICNRTIDFHVRRDNWRFKHSCSWWGVSERGLTNPTWSWRQYSYLPPLGLNPFGTVSPHETGTSPVLHRVTSHQNALRATETCLMRASLAAPCAQMPSFCSFLHQAHPLHWDLQCVFWKDIIQSSSIKAKWHRFLHPPI